METTDQILSEIEDLHCSIVKTHENFKKCPKARLTKGYLEAKINCLNDYWNSFKTAHTSLIKSVPKEQRKRLEYFNKDVYYSCEESYMQTKADMKDLLDSLHSTVIQSARVGENKILQREVPQVKLPRIQLPSFSGSYEDWPTFQDLFLTIVDKNETLSCVQKLHYLKSSVTGDAENLLKHIQITENNYNQAWDILKGRYSNKRLIVTSILKWMFNQKKLQSQSASQIKSLLDTTTECLNTLKNLDVITEHWDPLVIYLVVNKLDLESHKEWEEFVSKEMNDKLPTLMTLTKFMEMKFRTLELLSPGSTRDRTTVRSYHVTTTEKVCPLCNGNHALCHCKSFGKMEPTMRTELVKTKTYVSTI
ncbi:unnamed protein product [Parnassius mnemosyne]|uniref:Uncharacterized protein n=1 Tax=Parnassius mnemosyne TaxID=213953 RepID=A0AAV1KFH7_9NEOP